MKLNLLVLSLLPLGVFAQTDSLNLKKPSLWTTNLQTGLNISQASYSGNWKAGGINSISLGTFLNFKAVKKTAA